MGYKKCRICERELEETEDNFTWRKDSEAFRLECHGCISEINKARYRANREKRLAKAADYRNQIKTDPEKLARKKAADKKYQAQYNANPENAEKIRQQRRDWESKNRARRNELARKRRARNPEQHKKKAREWLAANPEKAKEYVKKRIARAKERYATDPEFRIRKLISNEVNRILIMNGGVKGGSILDYLPFTPAELKTHLENHPKREDWMTWDNYGLACKDKRTWQLDHIIPQSKLPYDSMSHQNFRICWALENLQPLESITNIKKGNK